MQPRLKPRGKEISHKVRSALVLKGTTLYEVCKDHGIDDSNIYKALSGKLNSPKAKKDREIVIRAAFANKRIQDRLIKALNQKSELRKKS